MSRIAFVTNFCPHYRVRTFETLAKHHDVDYYFFSAGDEWYWLQEHGSRAGEFKFRRLPGIMLAGTRITPTLPFNLWRGRYDVYIKCINGRFALPMTYLTARLTGRPFILWTGVWMRLQTRAHRLFYPITRYLYRHADAVVVYGHHVKRFLEGEGVRSDRIFLAAHAVDNAAYARSVSSDETAALRQELHIDPNAKVVLYVGRLEAGKGLPTLLQAFGSLQRHDAVLVIAGAGSDRFLLEQIARDSGVSDRVRFPGYVAPSDAVKYYALAWVYVLPSVTTTVFREPWGLVVNEAFNQGVPVIVTDSVGAAAGGLVRHGANGLVVAEGDPIALTQALRTILDDPELRAALGQDARSTIAEWDNDRMVDGFLRAVRYVLGVADDASDVSCRLR